MTAVPSSMQATGDSLSKVTELLWEDALRHLKSTNNEVLLPSNVTDFIGHENLEKIKSRLCNSNLISAPVVAFVDESIDALRVMRTPAFSGTAVSVASHKRTQDESTSSVAEPHDRPPAQRKSRKVPRPQNAFILYRSRRQPEIKATYPEFCNNDISIILGKQWKNEPEYVKAEYRAQAEELKRQHAREHPGYHYAPRRPSEKKRRSRPQARTSKAACSVDLRASGAPVLISNRPTSALTPEMAACNIMECDTGFICRNEDANHMLLSPSDVIPDELDANGFGALVQEQARCNALAPAFGDESRHPVCHDLSTTETCGNPFKFSDFLADFY